MIGLWNRTVQTARCPSARTSYCARPGRPWPADRAGIGERAEFHRGSHRLETSREASWVCFSIVPLVWGLQIDIAKVRKRCAAKRGFSRLPWLCHGDKGISLEQSSQVGCNFAFDYMRRLNSRIAGLSWRWPLRDRLSAMDACRARRDGTIQDSRQDTWWRCRAPARPCGFRSRRSGRRACSDSGQDTAPPSARRFLKPNPETAHDPSACPRIAN